MIHPSTPSALDVQQPTPSAGRCPVHHQGPSDRKSPKPDASSLPRLELDSSGVWQVRGYHEARTILRGESRQAGFKAEQQEKMGSYMKPPVLYLEGEPHKEQRRLTARFFTPVTTRAYHGLMERYADEIIADLKRAGRADLSDLTMKIAVRVAGQVIGLTNSLLPGMDQRIATFFKERPEPTSRIGKSILFFLNQRLLLAFYLLDVLPAIRAHRKSPKEDLISHLIDSDYSNVEILTECLTYGAAGMGTTREFIAVAAWYLLEQPELRAWYLRANEEERYAFLHELLRLEPVVGNLYRRMTEPVEVESEGKTVTIPAGATVQMSIHAINADATVVGENPLQLCPMREMAETKPRAAAAMMSFGDGHHRCPGAYIAIQETDIFLLRLLALDTLRVEKEPTLIWNSTVSGYEVRDFIVSLAPA